MTAPQFRSAGAFIDVGRDITVSLPAGYQAGDVLLLVVEDDVGTAVTVPTGWTAIYNTPGRLGRLFWKRAVAGETAPFINTSGERACGRILAFSGCRTSGIPVDIDAGTVNLATGTAFATAPSAVATSQSNALVVAVVYGAIDSTTPQASGWAAADLTGLTELADNWTTRQTGGGFAVAAGVQTSRGNVGAVTGALATSTDWLTIQVPLLGTAPTDAHGGLVGVGVSTLAASVSGAAIASASLANLAASALTASVAVAMSVVPPLSSLAISAPTASTLGTAQVGTALAALTLSPIAATGRMIIRATASLPSLTVGALAASARASAAVAGSLRGLSITAPAAHFVHGAAAGAALPSLALTAAGATVRSYFSAGAPLASVQMTPLHAIAGPPLVTPAGRKVSFGANRLSDRTAIFPASQITGRTFILS